MIPRVSNPSVPVTHDRGSAGGGLAPRRQPTICSKCGEHDPREDCDGNGWLEAIGPCRDGSYITSRPCPYDNPFVDEF